MDKISLNAKERAVIGKKVKKLRDQGIIPAHVFGNKVETESVSVDGHEFLQVLKQAGETGVISLKIGEERVRPVMVRGLQVDPVSGKILNIDFYQVNLKQKVKVPVPLVLVGEEPESVKLGDTVVLQTLAEVEVEALPTDLVDNIEVNIEVLKEVDDAITVENLNYDRSLLTVLAEPEEVVVKLAPAVTEEMKALMEEQQAEAAAAAETAEEAEGEVGEAGVEGGEEGAEGTEGAEANEGENKSVEGGEEPKAE